MISNWSRQRPSRGSVTTVSHRTFVLGLILALLLAACGGTEEPEDEGTAPPGPDTGTEATGTDAGPEPGDEAAAGGTFVIAAASEIATLDPQATTELTTHRVIAQIYDTLIVANNDRELFPHLASEFEVSEDGLTYTFQLREDVTFHNGEPLTADDVVFTFERWLEGDSPNAWIIDGVSSVAADGDYTVTLQMSEPRRDLLLNLARNDAVVLNREAVEEAGDAFGTDVVIGTGPFQVREWNPSSELVLERFEDYSWGPEGLYDNTGPAHLDEVIWRIIPDEQTRLLELQSGGVNALPPRLPFHEVQGLEENPDIDLFRFPLGSTVLIAFHLDSANQGEQEVRQAVLHAIDRQVLIDQVLYGNATLGVGLVAPGVPGHCPDCAEFVPDYDPERAEQILEDAGWTMGGDGIRERDGEPLEIVATVYDLVPYPEAYTAIQEQLRAVGVALDVQVIEAAQVFAMYRESTHGMWSTSIPHETAVQGLYNFLHSDSVPDPNRFPWQDEETDALLDTMLSTTDEQEYQEASEEVQRIVLENALFTPWFHEEGIVAVTGNVTGYEPYAYANHIFFKLLDTRME